MSSIKTKVLRTRKVFKHKGALYVEADGVAGFAEDLNHLFNHLPSQVEALLSRAKKFKLNQIVQDLEKFLNATKAFSKRRLGQETQELPIAASSKSNS